MKLAGLGTAGLAVAIDRSGFCPGTSSAASEALAATGLGAGAGTAGNCGLGTLGLGAAGLKLDGLKLAGLSLRALAIASLGSGEGTLGSRPATGWELTSLIGVSSSRLRAAEASAALGTTEAGL